MIRDPHDHLSVFISELQGDQRIIIQNLALFVDIIADQHFQLFVNGNDDRLILCSRLDNLGKGASGAAVQCLNIMMGIDETTGLL